MHRSMMGFVAGAALLTAAPSQAQQPLVGGGQGYYAGVSGGWANFFDDDNLDYDFFGFVVAGQVGTYLRPNVRVEGELAFEWTEAEIDGTSIDVDVTVVRPSISAYYDFTTISFGGLTPYAGGGLGISFLEADPDGLSDDDDTELSAHVEAGGTLTYSPNLDLVPAARLEFTDDASNFQLRFGARFSL